MVPSPLQPHGCGVTWTQGTAVVEHTCVPCGRPAVHAAPRLCSEMGQGVPMGVPGDPGGPGAPQPKLKDGWHWKGGGVQRSPGAPQPPQRQPVPLGAGGAVVHSSQDSSSLHSAKQREKRGQGRVRSPPPSGKNRWPLLVGSRVPSGGHPSPQTTPWRTGLNPTAHSCGTGIFLGAAAGSPHLPSVFFYLPVPLCPPEPHCPPM